VRDMATIAERARAALFGAQAAPVVWACSLAVPVLSGLAVWWAARSLQVTIGLFDCVALVPSITLLAALPASLAGWGVREASAVVLLSLVGVTLEEALLLSMTLGALQLLASLPGAAVLTARGKELSARAQRAVFFDRDGTLMENVGYCNRPELVRPLPGVKEALARLKRAGFKIIIVTNQSGIGRGLITEQQYQQVHATLIGLLGEVAIDATYVAPEAPDQASDRRKPRPGMVLEAAAEHAIDLGQSFFVGDMPSDVQCGASAGVRTILLERECSPAAAECSPDFRAKDLAQAVEWIVRGGA
jgi:D-glycero-D-manno-heptose 1,7-bisphosphate phosphatase